MTNPMIRIHNIEIDEIIDREMTDEEYTEFLNPSYLKDPQYIKQQAEQAAKDAARQAVLDKLGLTADEVAALLG